MENHPIKSRETARFYNSTYRRLDVGADATDARADSPGREGPSELDSKPLWPGLSTLPASGNALENCDDAPVTASVIGGRDADWESIEDEEWLLL